MKFELNIGTTIVFMIVLFLLLTFSYACGNSNSDDEPQAPTVFYIGDTWTIRGTFNGAEQIMTIKISDEDDGYYVLETSYDPILPMNISRLTSKLDKQIEKVIEQEYAGEDMGVPFNSISSYSYTASDSNRPLCVGKTWEVIQETTILISSLGETEKTTTTNTFFYKVDQLEKVTVPAGTFECYKTIKYENDSPIETSWHSNEVKLHVKKIDHRSNESTELISYSISN